VNLKLRLTVMNFLQFFVWGAWLITIGRYWFENRGWSGTSFGAIFSTMGISALFMPSLMGIVADRWINAEKLYGALHILGGVFLCLLPQAANPNQFFWLILATMLCYMPTISLAITVAYNALKERGMDVSAITRRSGSGARSASSPHCGPPACSGWKNRPASSTSPRSPRSRWACTPSPCRRRRRA